MRIIIAIFLLSSAFLIGNGKSFPKEPKGYGGKYTKCLGYSGNKVYHVLAGQGGSEACYRATVNCTGDKNATSKYYSSAVLTPRGVYICNKPLPSPSKKSSTPPEADTGPSFRLVPVGSTRDGDKKSYRINFSSSKKHKGRFFDERFSAADLGVGCVLDVFDVSGQIQVKKGDKEKKTGTPFLKNASECHKVVKRDGQCGITVRFQGADDKRQDCSGTAIRDRYFSGYINFTIRYE